MPLPPNSILLGALRWLRELRDGNPDMAHSVLTTSPGYSDLTPTTYALALNWLREVDLVNGEGLALGPGVLDSDPVRVLQLAIEHDNPSWLADADLTIQQPDQLPEDVASLAK